MRDVRVGILAKCSLNQSVGLFTLGLGSSSRVIMRQRRVKDQGLDGKGFYQCPKLSVS